MTGYGGRRSQAERDEITVEIGYALCSAAFAAAVVFGAVAGPALVFDLPDTVSRLLKHTGLVLAPVLFAARVISVLVRFRQEDRPSPPAATDADAGRGRSAPTGPGARPSRPLRTNTGTQPSQPGRTSPDS